MNNPLHQKGIEAQLKQLKKEEAQELAQVQTTTWKEWLLQIAKIKLKYYQQRRDARRNNYLNNSQLRG